MKYLKTGLIAVLLMVGLLSCVNSNDTAGTAETKPIDTVIAKTIIVDVRTKEEWIDDGHANCSVNYPLDELEAKAASLKNYEEVIIVCRSGHRAGIGKELLEKARIKNIINKGAWQNITCK